LKVKLVLVGTEGEINLGLALRLAANFEVERVVLVSPRVEIGDEALKFAARGAEMVDSVVVVDRLEDAFEGEELRACTSAIASLEGDVLRQAMSPEELVTLWAETGIPLALVFGRESTGLTREELKKCDVLVKIPASGKYPTLNLTHAIAILLYQLFRRQARPERAYASRDSLEFLRESFSLVAREVLRDPNMIERAETAFDRMLKRSLPSEVEARIVSNVLRRAWRRMRCSSR